MRVCRTLPLLVLLLLACSSGLVHAAKKKAPKVERKELIERLVPGVTGPDDKGQYYIEHEGKKWAVLQSKEEDGTPRMIFISTKGFSIMYTDPRTGEAIEIPEDVAAEARIAHAAAPPPPPIKNSEDMAAGLPGDAELDEQGYWFITDNEDVKHLVYKDEGHKRFYFHNSKTGATSWVDPRKEQPAAADTEDDAYEDPEEAKEGAGQEGAGDAKEEL